MPIPAKSAVWSVRTVMIHHHFSYPRRLPIPKVAQSPLNVIEKHQTSIKSTHIMYAGDIVCIAK